MKPNNLLNDFDMGISHVMVNFVYIKAIIVGLDSFKLENMGHELTLRCNNLWVVGLANKNVPGDNKNEARSQSNSSDVYDLFHDENIETIYR